MSRPKPEYQFLSRRALLKTMGLTPLVLRAAPLHGCSFLFAAPGPQSAKSPGFAFADVRLPPRYPAKSPLADVLRLVPPGSDEYISEKYAAEIQSLLNEWGRSLIASVSDHAALAKLLAPAVQASSLVPAKQVTLRSGGGLDIVRRSFPAELAPGREQFLREMQTWLGQLASIETAEFEITSIEQIAAAPLTLRLAIRYDFVATRSDRRREERVGFWQTEWARDESTSGSQPDLHSWTAQKWQAGEGTAGIAQAPSFIDVSSQALVGMKSYTSQMLRGADYWRTVLDGACGIDVYGNNGIGAGDFDNDGFDDLYVCQPAGLPNRLYRNRGDGMFEDVTEKAGVGVLDGTACALFADFGNKGVQDLLVVCGSGPLLFLNQGDGRFALKRDAFKFKSEPQGTFTHAAIADYDGDGRLDIYFCLYSYYVGLDQYHYPVPYFDARNGPPNFLLHNRGDATFEDRTEAAGLNAENNRYSFACAWGDSQANGRPDLYVANDFGRANLYRNNGDGTFTAVSSEAHIQDVGAGMSAAWSDIDNDGREDIYSANMWSAAGQRVAAQAPFHANSPEDIRALYQRHARGNALYRNQGDGAFQNIGRQAGVEMGRWSWCSDFWDFDHDGYPDLYIANGYISAPERSDLASFFWRQVVGKSPNDATPSLAYERGWQALNELVRSDASWSGYERNVMFANNRDGTFSEVSGAVGLDFPEDCRSFALADLDHDGRLEVILKSRNAPQLRILHNSMKELGDSISFRLQGKKSNRDAIGAAITVEAGTLRQTKYLQAGSGFLAQHSKEMFFGLGNAPATLKAIIRWPSGLSQTLENLPANHRIEVEEGSPSFAAKPFAGPSSAYARAAPPPIIEPLPSTVETWLIDPLKAPGFSLPDLAGETRSLQSFEKGPALLAFWATNAPHSLDLLKLLSQEKPSQAAGKLAVVAINVDRPADNEKARSFATREAFPFPVLFATEEVAGIYNIVYRYLFDRRRDLAIPTSFLLDTDSMIVKVYQGPVTLERLIADATSIPTTAAARLRRALPFAGTPYQEAFQRNDFTYGVAMFQHGYLEQAAESFRQVIAAKPNDAEGYYNLGTLSLKKNDFTQARQYLEQTLKLKPNYPEAWNNLGMMAAQQGNAEEAIQDFQQSLSLRPGYAIALLNLGNVYRRQGARDKAKNCLDHALDLQPDDPEVNYSLGMLYAQQDQMQRASDYLRKAVELRPDYPEALNNLGVLYVREQDYAKAEEQFQTAIQVAPAYDQSYLNLGRLYALRSDKEKAIEVLRQLLQLQPQNAAATQALEMLQRTP